MKKLIALLLLAGSSAASAAFIPNASSVQFVSVTGSTVPASYQGIVSSVPVAIQGTASVQVVNSTIQVQVGNTVPVTGTFFQATQPISGQITLLQPTVIGATVTFNGTQPVSSVGSYTVTPGSGGFSMGFVGVTGSTVSPSYQGVVSSVPVAIQGVPTVQVINSTFQVQVAGGSLAANQSVNVAQMAGVTTSMNTGVRDTGTQRVTIATNDLVPGNITQIGGVTVLSPGTAGGFAIGGPVTSGSNATGQNPVSIGVRVTSTTIPTAASDAQVIYHAGDNIGRSLVTGMPWGLILSTYSLVMSSNGTPGNANGGTVLISSAGAQTRTYLCGCTFVNTTITSNEAVFSSPPGAVGTIANTQFVVIPSSFTSSSNLRHDCMNPFFASAINSNIGIWQTQTLGQSAAIHYSCTYYKGP